MTRRIRLGDVVIFTLGYSNGIPNDVYCKISKITDYKGDNFSEYMTITGCGDRNSKIIFEITGISYVKNIEKQYNGVIPNVDPHKIYLINIDEELKKIKKDIKNKKNLMNFLKCNRNREDKLNILLNEN